MTDEEIEALRKLEKAATPGPWESDRDNLSWTESGGYAQSYVNIGIERWSGYFNDTADQMCQQTSDADFIAESRSAIPKLLDEVERLKVERDDAIEKAVSFAVDHPCYKLSKELEAENEKLRDREKILVEALHTIMLSDPSWTKRDDICKEALKRVEET